MFRSNAAFLILGLGALSFIHGHSSPHRRRLSPDTNIINALHEQMAEGIDHPRFTLTAEYETQGGGLFTSSEPFDIDVVLTNPSVAETTSFSVDGGPRTSVQSTSKFFIADDISDLDLSKQFAILTVDEEQGLVSGLVQKDGKLLKLEQRLGGPTFVTEASAFDPPKDWKCAVAHDTHAPVAKENPPGSDGGGRRVEQSHEHHEHHTHHSHEDGHSHHVHTLNLNEADSIFSQVANIDPNMLHGRRRLYQTDDFPLKWSYQVDLYIEIDQTLVNKHDTDQVNMPNTINYVNTLITAASSVFEREVDTHLHVLHIAKTTIYDGQTTTSGALDIMMNQYSNANAWHYTDSVTGETPDLHHAILGRSLGGGVAYVSAICNSQYGYGVSAGIQGSMQDIGGEMFWDLTVIMHELGHNFGSYHTHDLDGYNPKVDACGDGQCTSLIDGGTLQSGEATIMSYCHLCTGGETNVGATFGGHWNGGDRSNVNNWVNNDLVKGWSQDARRVSKTMYEHISSRNSCVEPYLPVPSQFCSKDSDCDNGNSCSIGKCNVVSGTCSVETKDGCCGNGKCEAGENGSNCYDCGPTTLPTPTCSTCWIPYSAMFDIEAINDIDITSISFMIYGGTSNIKVYTAPQSYTNIATNSNSWTLIASGSVAVSNWANIRADIADIPLSAGSKRAFYIVASGQLAIAEDTSTPLAADTNLKLLNPTRVSFSTTEFGSASSGVYSWVGSITYTPNGGAATSSPTRKPTNLPTTKSPTKWPVTAVPTRHPVTLAPSRKPSRNPTKAPSRKPTAKPTTTPAPSRKPTTAPTKSPITSKPTTTSAGNCYPRVSSMKIESTTGEQIHIIDFKAFSSGGDVASGGSAQQSSTFNNLAKFQASSAIDGDLSTLSHTNDNNPWWKVDLRIAMSEITSIEIKNRNCGVTDTGNCLCRLSNAKLLLLDNSGSVVAEKSFGDTCGKFALTLDMDKSFSCSAVTPSPTPSVIASLPRARYVKLHSITGMPIQVNEVEVYTTGSVNVALGKMSSQSSTLNSYGAARAVDGNANSFSHTNDQSPAFEVDLGAEYQIQSVKIVNRYCGSNPDTDPGCLCRLSHVILSLFDDGKGWVDTTAIGDTCNQLEWTHDFSVASTC